MAVYLFQRQPDFGNGIHAGGINAAHKEQLHCRVQNFRMRLCAPWSRHP
jgi:hypothetical protein